MKNDYPLLSSDRIWNEYRTRLYRFTLNRINDPVSAEDIVQDVLAKALEHLDELEDQQKIFPWIYQITRNAIIDYYRKHRLTEEFDEALIIQDFDMKKEDVEKDLARCMMPLLKRLPPHYREAVILSEIEGLTQKEVAAKQGLSLSGAKSRVQRGRQKLKTVLLECCKIERGHRGSIIGYKPNQKCSDCK